MNASRHALGNFTCLSLAGYFLLGLLVAEPAIAQEAADKPKIPSWIWNLCNQPWLLRQRTNSYRKLLKMPKCRRASRLRRFSMCLDPWVHGFR